MTLSMDRINKARELGYSDDDIVDSISRKDPGFGDRITKAKSLGYDSKSILSSIEKKLSTSLQTENVKPLYMDDVKPEQNPWSFVSPETDKAFNEAASKGFESYKKGLRQSTSGLIYDTISGNKPQDYNTEDPGFWHSLIEQAGVLTGDAPYIAAGGTIGSVLGSEFGPLGTAAGSGFGSLALPAFLKESLRQYHDFIEQGNDLTYKEFLQRSEKVANKTLTEGVNGFILGNINKALPQLEKIPGIKKLFEYRPVHIGAGIGLETAAMAAIPALSEGRLPEARDFAIGLAMALGFKVPKGIGAIKDAIKQEISRLEPKNPSVSHITDTQVDDLASKIDKLREEKLTPFELHRQIEDLTDALFFRTTSEKPTEKPAKVTEKYTERENLTPEQVIKEKESVKQAIDNLPNGNWKNVAEDAFEKEYVRTPEQLEKLLDDYDEKFPSIQGKTIKDRNRKFVNKYAEKNIEERNIKETSQGKVPVKKMSLEERFRRSQLELNEAKRSGDAERIKEAQKKRDLAKYRLEEQQKQKANKQKANKKEKPVETQENKSSELSEKTKQAISKPVQVKVSNEGQNISNIGNIGSAISDNFYRDTFKALQEGKKTLSGGRDEFMEAAKVNYDKGLIKNENDLIAFRKVWDDKFNKPESGKIQVKSNQLTVGRPVKKKKKRAKKSNTQKPPQPIVETTGEPIEETIVYAESPLKETVDKTIDTVKEAWNEPKSAITKAKDAVNRAVFNYLAPLENIESDIPVHERPSTQIKMAHSAASEIGSVIDNGVFSNTTGKFESEGLKGIYGDYIWTKFTKDRKGQEYSLEELDAYRASKIALRRQREGKTTGKDTAEAQATVAKHKKLYEPIDQRISQYNKSVLQSYGKDLIGQDMINQWNKDYHASMYRVMDTGKDSILKTGSLTPKQPFYKFRGSKKKTVPTSEADIYNNQMLITNAKKNDSVLAYKKGVEAGKLPGKVRKGRNERLPEKLLEELEIDPELKDAVETLYSQTRKEGFTPEKNVIRGWENGKPFEIEVPEDVYNIYKSFAPKDRGIVPRVLSATNRLFSAGISLSPHKFISILGRDAWSSLVYSRTGYSPGSIMRAMGDIFKDRDIYKQFRAQGGDVYAARLSRRIDRARKIDDLITPGRKGIMIPFEKMAKFFRKYPEILSKMSMAVPLAEYKRALEKYGDTPEGRMISALEARQVTYDPTVKGGSTIVKELGNYIPFWNVSLQEFSKLGQSLKNKDTWLKGISSITLPTLMLKMYNELNPDYQSLTDEDKAAFWHIFSGDNHYRIPIPWLLGTTFKVVPEMFYEMAQGRGSEGWNGLYSNFLDNLSGDMPPLVQTYIEWHTNKSAPSLVASLLGGKSTAPPVVPRRLEHLPAKYQYTNRTSVLAKKFGEMWGVSPMKIERAIKANTGLLGAQALSLVDEIAYQTGLAEDKRPEQREKNYLLLGNFISNSTPSRTKYMDQFYELLEVARHESEIIKREGGQKNPKFSHLNTYNTKISAKFRQYRDVEDSKIDPKEKKQKLNQIQREINYLFEQAVTKAK